ncbi:hypothetical protein CVO_00770 [Sulfurimonas sp. CVO]|uniref:hypothetical protein n=1 Tax=Sulfurimonas sp. CVO TaxID=2283483 RepID=UPI00132EE811|nr:hypothetical protein [Sulfurimonas sp. CVO]QHG90453.1 hypothetical protein CVO_00770 [Sulfurimonas sp. CVO]
MSEDVEKLKKFSAQKIHEETHISLIHVQALLDENFEGMNSVQLKGFLSILEREYSLDLSELRDKANEYFQSNAPVEESVNLSRYLIKEKRNFTLLYIIFGIVVIAALTYFIIKSSEDVLYTIDNSVIESAKSNILEIQNDKNSSLPDENRSLNTQEVQELPEAAEAVESAELLESTKESELAEELKSVNEVESVEPQNGDVEVQQVSFKIIPKSKVWLGYIDLKNYKRYQETLSGEFSLDPKKEWLLLFGHGYIDIEINGEIIKFSNPKNIIFSYINSELKEIDMEEFKRLNKGKGW